MNTYRFSKIKKDLSCEFEVKIEAETVIAFSEITGDKNPLHLDINYAKETSFGKPVVFGQLVQSYFSTLAGMYLPGKYSLILNVETNFREPVFINDVLRIKGVVTKKIPFANVIIINTEIKNQNDTVVVNGVMRIKVLK